MSTRGKIAVLVDKQNFSVLEKFRLNPILGQYICLWCHTDMYPSHMVPVIQKHFGGAKGALKLVKESMGAYISHIDNDGELIIRNPERYCEYQEDPIEGEWGDAEYLYYFNGKTWKWADCHSDTKHTIKPKEKITSSKIKELVIKQLNKSNKISIIKEALSELKYSISYWETINMLNSGLVSSFIGTENRLSSDWYFNLLRVEVAYIISLKVFDKLGDDDNDFDDSKYSENIMKSAIKEVAKFVKNNNEYYTQFINDVKKYCPHDYEKYKDNISVNNLSEANKYFFGTENTDEVKRLFESELETDSDVMFTFEDTEESRMNEFLIKLKNATKQSLFAAKYRLCVLYSYLHSTKTRQVFDLHSNSTPEIKASLKKHHRIPEYTEILFYCIDKCLPENFTEFDSINLAFAVDINADEEYYHKPGREIQKSLTIIRNDLKKSFSKFFDVKDLYFDVDRDCYTVIVSVDYKV